MQSSAINQQDNEQYAALNNSLWGPRFIEQSSQYGVDFAEGYCATAATWTAKLKCAHKHQLLCL